MEEQRELYERIMFLTEVMLGYPVTIKMTQTANTQTRRTLISQNASQSGISRYRRRRLRGSHCRLRRRRRRRIVRLHPMSRASHRESNR